MSAHPILLLLVLLYFSLCAKSLPATNSLNNLRKRSSSYCFVQSPDGSLMPPNPEDCVYPQLDILDLRDLTDIEFPAVWASPRCKIVLALNPALYPDASLYIKPTVLDVNVAVESLKRACMVVGGYQLGGRIAIGEAGDFRVFVTGGVMWDRALDWRLRQLMQSPP
ncbi:hypothetical protein MMC06_000980 [Schaereria dolodes]|nr:hypothetical protein [Schaereria dolodes]